MRTECHSISVNTWNNCFHSAIVKKMLNRICIACFYRYGYADVLTIRNFILCILLCIPELKFIGFKNSCIFFVCELIIISAGNTKLYIPWKIYTGYCNSITGMILLCNCFHLCLCNICSCILWTFIFRLIFSVKDIICIFIRIFRYFRNLCYFRIVLFFIIVSVLCIISCITGCRCHSCLSSFFLFFFCVLAVIFLNRCYSNIRNFCYLRIFLILILLSRIFHICGRI